MEVQQSRPQPLESNYVTTQDLPPFPAVPTSQLRSYETLSLSAHNPKSAMDIDNLVSHESRPQRASSVTSGMSLEDLQAAETLEFLKNGTNSPSSNVARPPQFVQSRVEYSEEQQEPLLHLLTSQIPLLSSAVNNSMYAYSQTKSYSPVIRYPAEFIERNIGSPMAGTIGSVGRRTGVEGGLRWALQSNNKKRKSTADGRQSPGKDEMDIERGASSPTRRERRSSQLSETLPAYDAGGRSPPYQAEIQGHEEQQLIIQSREGQAPPGWQARLMISTSGLGVAMREDSLRSLKYCLSWLNWANDRLARVIVAVKNALKDWEERPRSEDEAGQAVLTARISALSRDIAQTVKQVVDIVSRYAGGALPQNAREIVYRHFSSLPLRFRYISMASSNNSSSSSNHSNNQNNNNNNNTNVEGQQAEQDVASNATRVLALAHEGLNMMTQVTRVVDDTLTSAQNWCDRLGRRTNGVDGVNGVNGQHQQQQQDIHGDVKMSDGNHEGQQRREKSVTMG